MGYLYEGKFEVVARFLKSFLLIVFIGIHPTIDADEIHFTCKLQNFTKNNGISTAEAIEDLVLKIERLNDGILIFGESENILIFATTSDFDGVSKIRNSSSGNKININLHLNDIQIDFYLNLNNGALKSVASKQDNDTLIETTGQCKHKVAPAQNSK